MFFPILALFFLLLLSAFFSSSETALLSTNPYKLDYLSQKGSPEARLIQNLLKKVDNLLATILIGNTLVNTAVASISTFIFLSLMEDKKQAVLCSTLVTTFLILVLSEITPKTYAAFNPLRLSLLYVRPLKIFIIVLSPLVKVFTFFSRLIFPFHNKKGDSDHSLNEDEARHLFSGIQGISLLRKRMLSGALDIGSRSVREVMVPRLQIKAVDLNEKNDQILQLILTTGFSRFPVFHNRIDNIKGVIHAKDIIPYLVDKKEIKVSELLRPPLFVPESSTLEQVLLQMQKKAIHMIFIVDEFGNMEGLVTLEDILEEVVGEIQDEYDAEQELPVDRIDEGVYIVQGNTPVKLVNMKVPLALPEKGTYTTFAGFFLDEFGRIPQEGDILEYQGCQLIVAKMTKHRINLIRVVLMPN